MKSYGQLWETMISEENLRAAWHEFRRHHASKKPVQEYERNLSENIAIVHERLMNGKWEPENYNQFMVYEPKPRIISCAAVKDRVVHHAFCRVCTPLIERRFIDQTYACRVGKGSHKALRRARELCRENRYYLKIDIHHYFDSVDHGILLGILDGMFREKQVRELIRKIVEKPIPHLVHGDRASCLGDRASCLGDRASCLGDRASCLVPRASGIPQSHNLTISQSHNPQISQSPNLTISQSRNLAIPKGLPIGNLTSQWFANLYLDAFDHYCVEQLGLGLRYLRYMDDILAFFPAKEEAWRVYTAMRDWLAENRLLALKDKATIIAPVTEGIPYLGLRVWGDRWRFQRKRLKRTRASMKRRYYMYACGIDDGDRFQSVVRSMEGSARHFGFKGIYTRIDRQFFNPDTERVLLEVDDKLKFQLLTRHKHRNLGRRVMHLKTEKNNKEKETDKKGSGEAASSGSNNNRQMRGGSYNNNASNCSSVNRNNNNYNNTNANYGFRLASDCESVATLYTRDTVHNPHPDTPAPVSDGTNMQSCEPGRVSAVPAAPKAPESLF